MPTAGTLSPELAFSCAENLCRLSVESITVNVPSTPGALVRLGTDDDAVTAFAAALSRFNGTHTSEVPTLAPTSSAFASRRLDIFTSYPKSWMFVSDLPLCIVNTAVDPIFVNCLEQAHAGFSR